VSIPDSELDEPTPTRRERHEPGCNSLDPCGYCLGNQFCVACETVHDLSDDCPVADVMEEER